MSQGHLRGYGLGLLALAVALSTTGYFLAGQILNRSPERMPLTPTAVARITSPGGTVELSVYRLINPRGVTLPRQSPQADRGILYSFMQPRDDGWTGLGLKTPVTVAFLDSRGKVLTILEVEPCPTPPQGNGCRVYEPGVVYRQVLEVKQGWFAQNRIGPGATVRLIPREAAP